MKTKPAFVKVLLFATGWALACDAAGAAGPAEQPRGETKPAAALVYVGRPASAGFAVPIYFFVDDQVVGVNHGNEYFFVDVAPGKHIFWSKAENVEALELEVEGGKTYYFQQKTLIGVLKARTELRLLDEAAGEPMLKECKKMSVMSEKERSRGAEHAAKSFARAKEELAK
ncbi:MAG: DUF2846 domain-containing protein [Acidobacteria bacterium]|nr:DUF2846 domain-containing protein [Acidobacteriota bacterium]